MINRERELEFLLERIRSERPEFLVLWGRRRLGKTTLLKELHNGHPSIYFLATRSSAHEQLRRIGRAMSEFFGDPLLQRTPPGSWEDVFIYLDRNLTQRTLLLIDEFPYLVDADPALPSEFQRGWDEYLSHNSRIALILNGSSLSMMERHVLGAGSPLYGRRTGQWRVDPLDLLQIQEFFPALATPELIETYAVVGGVPFYALQFQGDKTLAENVRRNILSKGAVLFDEVPFLLREEVREPRSYFPILGAIASGSRKFGEISSKTGLDRANLGKYLDTLRDLHLVRREVPVTETSPLKSRKGLYWIDDPFVDFWLRYVWPNLAALELDRVDEVWETRIAPDLPRYVAGCCERFAGALLAQPTVREWIGFEPDRIGRYWDRHVELDLVGVDRERKRAIIAEVKWSQRPVGKDVAQSLERRANQVAALATYEKRFLLISRSGFSSHLMATGPERLMLVDLRNFRLGPVRRGTDPVPQGRDPHELRGDLLP